MSLFVTAFFTPAEGAREALLDALGEFIPRVHLEAGCEYFALHEQGDGVLVAIEKWESEEHLVEHDRGAAVSDLKARLTGLLADPPRVTRMTAIALGDPAKGSI